MDFNFFFAVKSAISLNLEIIVICNIKKLFLIFKFFDYIFRSRADSVRSKSPLTASPASPGPLSNSLHGSFHSSLGSDGMSCSSARSSSASPDSARYSSTPVIFI